MRGNDTDSTHDAMKRPSGMKKIETGKDTRGFYIYYFFLPAFSADFVTEMDGLRNLGRANVRVLTLSSRLFGLVDGFDDTNGNGLSHVTDGETTERRVLVVRL